MSKMLRTLWSVITCEFCGTRHDLGICPNCGSRRTEGERQYLESPHIEKLRAMKQVVLRYKVEEELRIASAYKEPISDKLANYGYAALMAKQGYTHQLPIRVVELTDDQQRILQYIAQIVGKLTGRVFQFRRTAYSDTLHTMARELRTDMLDNLNFILSYLESALDVEEKLADVIMIQNGAQEVQVSEN